jgi:CHAD domain-containing protein
MATLAEFSAGAIAKNFRKILKHETEVIQTGDPEAIHQMRVGLRRLRTALAVFGFVLDMPKSFQLKRLKAIATDLGKIRDQDVLSIALEQDYAPLLSAREQRKLAKILHPLTRQRQQQMQRMTGILAGSEHQHLKQAYSDWLDKPRYQLGAEVPILLVLPDLMLPLVSTLLLHPGWQVEVIWQTEEKFSLESAAKPGTVQQSLELHGPVLHDLRKQVKRVRYPAELCAEFFGLDYAQQLKDFAELQDLLGHLNDGVALNAFFDQAGGLNLNKDLPGLSQLVQQKQGQQWQAWQERQSLYLSLAHRQSLRQLFLAIKAIPASDR